MESEDSDDVVVLSPPPSNNPPVEDTSSNSDLLLSKLENECREQKTEIAKLTSVYDKELVNKTNMDWLLNHAVESLKDMSLAVENFAKQDGPGQFHLSVRPNTVLHPDIVKACPELATKIEGMQERMAEHFKNNRKDQAELADGAMRNRKLLEAGLAHLKAQKSKDGTLLPSSSSSTPSSRPSRQGAVLRYRKRRQAVPLPPPILSNPSFPSPVTTAGPPDPPDSTPSPNPILKRPSSSPTPSPKATKKQVQFGQPSQNMKKPQPPQQQLQSNGNSQPPPPPYYKNNLPPSNAENKPIHPTARARSKHFQVAPPPPPPTGNDKAPEQDLSKRFWCQCGKNYTAYSALVRHILSNSNGLIFKCPECPNRFALHSSLKYHSRKVHNIQQTEQFGCRNCGNVYASFRELRNHRVDAHGYKRGQ